MEYYHYIGILISVATLLWWIFEKYIMASQRYWEKSGIRFVPFFKGIMSVWRLTTMPMHEAMILNQKEYGRIFGSYFFRLCSLSVAEPDIIRDVLVKEFPFFINRMGPSNSDPISDNIISVLRGEQWKRVRTIITPAFTTGKIKKMCSIILDSAKTAGTNLKTAAKIGEPVDVKRVFGAFTMDVIACSAFGTKIDSHNNPDNPFVVAAKNAFSFKINLYTLLMLTFPRLIKLLRYENEFQKAMKFFKEVTLQIIEERKRTGQKQNDFLQMMMDAAEGNEKQMPSYHKDDIDNDDDAHLFNEHNNVNQINHNLKGLNENELLAQCIMFFLAGYDTTASTLSFVCYNLALNSDCQETLIAEIDEVLMQNNNQLTYQGIQDMKYLDNVISETLRLYPPGTALMRQVYDDYKIESLNLTLKKNMFVSIPVYAIHRDPEFYPDPEIFDPNRFSAEDKAKRNPYTYLPFGAGPRNCVAMRFALIEIKFCLAYLLSQCRLKRCPKTDVPVKIPPGHMLLSPTEMFLAVEKRTDKVFQD